MKMLLRVLLLMLLLLGVGGAARTASAAGHQAIITWGLPADATAGTTYSIYRMAGACPAFPGTGFTLLTAGVTALTYTDLTVTVGTWCYYAEQVQNNTNSVPSNLAGGTAAPLAVIITVVVN